MTELKKEDFNREVMKERIEKALARYEASKTKPRKRFKLFFVDKPQGLTSELSLTGQSKPTRRRINYEQDQSR